MFAGGRIFSCSIFSPKTECTIEMEGILRPRFDRPSVRAFTKKCLPSVRAFTEKCLPSVRAFTKKSLPSVQQKKHLTDGYSKGSDRLTCTAQPGHGGKRRDSLFRRVSSLATVAGLRRTR